jgi:hypothetical protein
MLIEFADVIMAANTEKWPPREELAPADGLPSIFNPRAAVQFAASELRAVLAGKEGFQQMSRIQRDLTVVREWWLEREGST